MIADELRNLARILGPWAEGSLPARPEGMRSLIASLLALADRVEALERSTVPDEVVTAIDPVAEARIRAEVDRELRRIFGRPGEPA